MKGMNGNNVAKKSSCMASQSLVIGGADVKYYDDAINTITASARFFLKISRSLDSQQSYYYTEIG